MGTKSLNSAVMVESRASVKRDASLVSKGVIRKKVKTMGEAIIMQSIEDLFDSSHRLESIKFFTGEQFTTCAEMAGLTGVEQMRLLKMVEKAGLRIGN